jgi:hypothetical protein
MSTSNAVARRSARALRAALAGEVFVAGEAGYDQARRALLARCPSWAGGYPHK